MEFGQIPQEELPALTAYVQRQQLPMGAPADDESDADEDGTGEEFDAEGSASASGANAPSEGSDEFSEGVCCAGNGNRFCGCYLYQLTATHLDNSQTQGKL